MTGILLIDKPAGPTSHDVVARLRQTSRERRIGHTGTLDPIATGLLPLVFGRATRLAAFLTSSEKSYEAVIHLGVETETDDALGARRGPEVATLPDAAAIAEALDGFRGTFHQIPPRHSAKRVGGARAYELARRDLPVELKPVPVTVVDLTMVERTGPRVVLHVTASAGFYVRALARDLGARLGCGGYLAALRRTRVGRFDVADALPLAEAERLGPAIADRVIPPAEALADLPAVELTAAGLRRAEHGNWLAPEHIARAWPATSEPSGRAPGGGPDPPAAGQRSRPIRVLAQDGRLIALAERRGAVLHPVVVLG